MADWKSALRQVRKILAGANEDSGSQTTVGKPLSRPAVQTKAPIQNGKSITVMPSVEAFRRPVMPKEPPGGSLASSMQRKVTPASHPARPAPVSETLPEHKGVPASFVALSGSSLTRQKYFKMPEKWVADGAMTQLSTGHDNTAVDIVIGLDFGTSYTKAAVGLRDQILPVSWEGISSMADGYLLPTEYSLLGDGSCQLGQAPTVSIEHVRQRLKHPFINPAVSQASIATASIFVALVLRYIRAWVYLKHGKKIGRSKIRWILNIGAPSNGLESDRLERAYRRLGATAWILSQRGAAIGPDDALRVAEQAVNDQLPDGLFDLCVRPEFVAQIAGYVQSPQRKPGLHALVDVGGGTLDVVTFIVHEQDGEDVFPFLVPEVKPLGTQMLDTNRLVDALNVEPNRLPDELEPVLDAGEFARKSGVPEAHVCKRDRVFWEAVEDVVKTVFYKTKARRYRLSNAWTDGLTTFISGGGAKVDGYRNSVRCGGESQARLVNLMPLPRHGRVADFSGGVDEYQRISVACGLALDAFTLGHIRPAREVEDDLATALPVAERADRDELYPH